MFTPKIIFISAYIGLIFSFMIMPSVSAQSSEGRESITLSPVTSRYALEAGESVKGELTVLNDGDIEYTFTVYTKPYSVLDRKYNPDFNATPLRADAYKWVSFGTKEWKLAPGESTKIPYSISVPSTAAPGGHYGVLFAETQPADQKSTSVARRKRVGSLLYVNVKGDYKMEGSLTGSSIPWFQSQPPLNGTFSLQNTGNSDYEAATMLRVSDIFGRVKFVGEKPYVVLPQTTRDITLTWDKSPGLGIYKVEMQAKYLDKSDSRSGYVVVAPLWMPIVIVAVIAGAAFVSHQKRHHRR